MGGNVFKETYILDENGDAFTDDNRLPVDAEISGPIVDDSGQEKLVTVDPDIRNTLSEILDQLKIMNIHLQLITDNNVSLEDTKNT